MKIFNFNIGLVLAGGGANGAYQVGAMQALHELGLNRLIRVVSGTSIGALNAALFLMEKPELYTQAWEKASFDNLMYLKENEERGSFRSALKDLFKFDRHKASLHEFLLNQNLSLFSQKGLGDIIDTCIDFEKIQKSKKDLYVCAYNTNQKVPEYFRLNGFSAQNGKKVLLASSAVPFIYNSIEINGAKYSDGGVYNPLYKKNNVDNAPIKPVHDYGCRLVIVVYLDYRDRLKAEYKDSDTHYIEIYPSRPLENALNTSRLQFAKKPIARKIDQGYRDLMVVLAPLIVKVLQGNSFSKLLEQHRAYNVKLLSD